MKTLAWVILIGTGLAVFCHPLIFGAKRSPYGFSTWMSSILEFSLYLPICGRILGWW